MAARTFFPVSSVDNDLKIVPMKFTSLGVSAPTTFDATHISSITHDATGVWTVTLKDTYNSIQAIICDAEDSALTDLTCHGGTVSTTSVEVKLFDAGIATDGTSGNTVVSIVLFCKNSSV